MEETKFDELHKLIEARIKEGRTFSPYYMYAKKGQMFFKSAETSARYFQDPDIIDFWFIESWEELENFIKDIEGEYASIEALLQVFSIRRTYKEILKESE